MPVAFFGPGTFSEGNIMFRVFKANEKGVEGGQSF